MNAAAAKLLAVIVLAVIVIGMCTGRKGDEPDAPATPAPSISNLDLPIRKG